MSRKTFTVGEAIEGPNVFQNRSGREMVPCDGGHVL